jgi:hypothetical protein
MRVKWLLKEIVPLGDEEIMEFSQVLCQPRVSKNALIFFKLLFFFLWR